jgi:hypothetical protein
MRGAWRRVFDGAGAVAGEPAVSLAAALAAVVGALGERAALARVAEAARLGLDALGEAISGGLVGFAFCALLADLGLAAALTAYGQPKARLLGDGLRRLPLMVAVGALERLVIGTLAIGALTAAPIVLMRCDPPALGLSLLAVPILFLTLVQGAAAAATRVLVGRGLPLGRALAGGYDLVLRRIPSLCRLAPALLSAQLPLLFAAAALRGHGLFAALSVGVARVAALLAYAALGELIADDGELLATAR